MLTAGADGSGRPLSLYQLFPPTGWGFKEWAGRLLSPAAAPVFGVGWGPEALHGFAGKHQHRRTEQGWTHEKGASL